MKSPLHILRLDDNPNDAQLVERTLATGRLPCSLTRVATRAEYMEALDDKIIQNFPLTANRACVGWEADKAAMVGSLIFGSTGKSELPSNTQSLG
jgi:hypothetical protein